MINIDSINEAKMTTSVIIYLNTCLLYTTLEQSSFCALVRSVCGDDLYDKDFFTWFCRRINKRPERVKQLLDKYISAGMHIPENRGRRKLSIDQQQIIYNMWHEHSIVTVDRRNGRDQVKIKMLDFERFKHLKHLMILW